MRLLKRYRYIGKHYDSVTKFIARQETFEVRAQETRRAELTESGSREDWVLVEK